MPKQRAKQPVIRTYKITTTIQGVAIITEVTATQQEWNYRCLRCRIIRWQQQIRHIYQHTPITDEVIENLKEIRL